jgi:hypothetical protein
MSVCRDGGMTGGGGNTAVGQSNEASCNQLSGVALLKCEQYQANVVGGNGSGGGLTGGNITVGNMTGGNMTGSITG